MKFGAMSDDAVFAAVLRLWKIDHRNCLAMQVTNMQEQQMRFAFEWGKRYGRARKVPAGLLLEDKPDA